MSWEYKDRSQARRVRRIMKEATIGPVFTRPLSKPKTLTLDDPQMEHLIGNRKFLRRKFRVAGIKPGASKPEKNESRRGLLGVKPPLQPHTGSNYLSILKQKLFIDDAQTAAKLEISLSRPTSALCNVSRKDLLDTQTPVAPQDLSVTLGKITPIKARATTPVRRLVTKMMGDASLMCNCPRLDCVCGKAPLKQLIEEKPETVSESIEQFISQCSAERRSTAKLKLLSLRWLRGAISEVKLDNRKMLRSLQAKRPVA